MRAITLGALRARVRHSSAHFPELDRLFPGSYPRVLVRGQGVCSAAVDVERSERPIGGQVTELGELHVRPVMAGYGYTQIIHRYSITADVLGSGLFTAPTSSTSLMLRTGAGVQVPISKHLLGNIGYSVSPTDILRGVNMVFHELEPKWGVIPNSWVDVGVVIVFALAIFHY